MAADRLLWDFKGLVTAPGRLARAEASCTEARNVVVDAPGVARKRRGYANLGAIASGIPWKVFSPRSWPAGQVLPQTPPQVPLWVG